MKAYLGDSVYAEYRKGYIILTTNNGLGDTNTIYLEPDVRIALQDYIQRVTKRVDDEAMHD